MNSVDIEMHIDAAPATVWQFWVDPVRMCEWWGSSVELDPAPGGIYRVEMGDGPIMRGRYVELVPHERLVFLFGWERGSDAVPPSSTRVEVTLTPEAGGTRLTLHHHELPDDASVALHRDGWDHFLGVLGTVACRPPA